MKTYLTILIAAFLFTACKKESNCWECSFSPVNGQIPPSRQVCTDTLPKVLFDENGNALNFNCTR